MVSTTKGPRLAAALDERLRGGAIGPGHPAYDEARQLHNGMIERRPAVIARCADAADVIAAVAFARAEKLELAVRCGAHNAAGFAGVDGGLVVDLAPMRYVQVDPERRVARVGGGTTLGDLDHATHAFGLAAPAGTVSTTGIGGLTLGGGIGYLTRRHGLTIDNLLGADVVLADGSFVRADEESHPDLFWALRGGGGNFGVVTEFRLGLHPVSTVHAGPLLFPVEETERIAALYREWLPAQPDDVYALFATLTVPPVEPFPAELRLRQACGLVCCNTGGAERSDAALRPFREAGPMLDGVAEMPFPVIQSAFDALVPAGTRMYWRAAMLDELSDAAAAEIRRWAEAAPTWGSQMFLFPLDGAAARVGADETAWGWRGAAYSEVIVGVDYEAGRDDELREWAVGFSEACAPYALDGAYANFMQDEGPEPARRAYGVNYPRLQRLKARYDPENVFHVNQNIVPAG